MKKITLLLLLCACGEEHYSRRELWERGLMQRCERFCFDAEVSYVSRDTCACRPFGTPTVMASPAPETK